MNKKPPQPDIKPADLYKDGSPYVHPRAILPHMPNVTANAEQLKAICNGRNVNLPDFSDAQFVKVFADQVTLVAVCERVANTLFHPHTVLYNAEELKALLR